MNHLAQSAQARTKGRPSGVSVCAGLSAHQVTLCLGQLAARRLEPLYIRVPWSLIFIILVVERPLGTRVRHHVFPDPFCFIINPRSKEGYPSTTCDDFISVERQVKSISSMNAAVRSALGRTVVAATYSPLGHGHRGSLYGPCATFRLDMS